MKTLALFLAFIALTTNVRAQQTSQSDWRLGGSPAVGYSMSARGQVTTEQGAQINLKSVTEMAGDPFGSASASMPADTHKLEHVRLIADFDSHDVSGGASPWIRVDADSVVLDLNNGMDGAVKGTTTASHREVEVFIPANATRIAFGMILAGSGEVNVHTLRLVVSRARTDTVTSPAATALLDSAITIVQHASLWRDTISWTPLLARVRGMARGAKTTDEVYPAINALLAGLGDHHSFHMKPVATQQFTSGGAQNRQVGVKQLSDRVGYISIPAYMGVEPSAMHTFAQTAYDAMSSISASSTCGWVVDLRDNGGGNMWPMLGALHPFFGNDGLGAFVTAAGSAPLWHANNLVNIAIPTSLTSLYNARVAVLTSPHTGSSGEAVTISFRGRPNTRSFGEATAGLSTANQDFRLPDGSMMLVTVSVEADRNGVRYGHAIVPDEVIKPGAGGGDPQRDAAIAWLKQVCGRRQ